MRPWSPVRSISFGGIVFGLLVILAGVVLLAWSLGWITWLTWQAFCAIGVIVVGFIILGGVLWGRSMMRGGWRRWRDYDWEQGWQRPPSPPPQPPQQP